MKRIAAALIPLFTTLVLANPPAPVSGPMPEEISCYITVSQQTADDSKTCGGYGVSECAKHHRICTWMGLQRQCRGLVSNLCRGLAPKVCKFGVELVTELPAKPAKGSHKFHCNEKNPITLKKL